MSQFQFVSKSEDDTKNFAKSLASYLQSKDIIVLTGDLGSGKTKFTEGILSYFGLENEISSPTFTIVNEYKKDNINIYHFDVYRLEDSSEFYEIGGEEYFENGICLIEWGELIEDVLPKDYIHITFLKNDVDENIRILNIDTSLKRLEDYFENIKY
jgi:tRNA threonylcarbamoyladenosine biosynthesis protein TsaE